MRAVWTAAGGERRVFEGHAYVVWDDGVQTKGFVQNVLEIFHVFQVLVGWLAVGADCLEDFLTQFGGYGRVYG